MSIPGYTNEEYAAAAATYNAAIPPAPEGYTRWATFPVYRVSDADCAICIACRWPIIGNQFWGLDKAIWLHASNGRCPNMNTAGRIQYNRSKNFHAYNASTAIQLRRLEAL